MSEYLYGAAVQGIQGFIFQTNKLREIVGASELVESICTDLFAAIVYAGTPEEKETNTKKRREKLLAKLEKDENAIVNAAGNIKYIFTDKEECERVARIFPMTVMQFAPGITISQSVVEIKGSFADAVQQLEKNLRVQRNRQVRDMAIGLMGILRSRTTGLPVTHVRKDEYMDSATYHKLFDDKGERKTTFEPLCLKSFGERIPPSQLPLDIEKMTGSNDWIAIIHADGNGLGQIVQKIGTDKSTFKKFSRALDEATAKAAQLAFDDVMADLTVKGWRKDDTVPIRPIVLSGDDLTMICRADIAIPYAKAFLLHFEHTTAEMLGDILRGEKADGSKGKHIFTDKSEKLTACAGIAFIKSSFPFHFGYGLAESLCSRAKKDTKAIFNADAGNLPASCLMFHKVQDSFVTDFNDIAERELTPQKNISFEYGPYYLDTSDKRLSDRWSVADLTACSNFMDGEEGNKVKSGLRNWLTLLHENPEMADQRLNRLIDVATPRNKKIIKSVATGSGSAVRKVTRKGADGVEDEVTVYPVYDILAIHTIDSQVTNTKTQSKNNSITQVSHAKTIHKD